jgi:multiple sugar transport system permease protein
VSAHTSGVAETRARTRLLRTNRLSRRGREIAWCYAFMLPSLVLAALFTFYPIVASWYFSLLDWSGVSPERTFIGLQNYTELLADSYFWQAFERSFGFALVAVPIRLGLALIVAIILNNRALRLAPAFRAFFFVPVVTTTAIVGILMQFLFSPFHGPINQVLMATGLVAEPIDFLGNPGTALWTIMAVQIWKTFGITMIYWLAALQAIPAELYEAARVDGAGSLELLRRITLPLLKPFAAIIALITAVSTLRVFDLVQTMTGGGPFFASEVMEVYIYRHAFSLQAFSAPRLGYASAAGVFFGVAVMVVAVVQGVVVRRANAARAFRRSGAAE